MASPSIAWKTCSIVVRLFDGTRRSVAPDLQVLLTVRDGNQKRVYWDYLKGPQFELRELPFHDNFIDSYTVLASASGYDQAGFTPVKVSPGAPGKIDLMLLSKDATYNFSQARWDILQNTHPQLAALFSAGGADEDAARDRYTNLMEQQPATLACFFNLATAMAAIDLPSGRPLDYFRELIWDSMQPDRFFAWADPELVAQVRQAAHEGKFAPEPGTALFHPGATSSFKQIQFGEANVQLTFHEDDTRIIDGTECIKVEPDIDYYKDLGAHALLEVVPNSLTGGKTDARQVYVLRWIAGRHAGVPEFNPPYVIA